METEIVSWARVYIHDTSSFLLLKISNSLSCLKIFL